MYIKITLPKKWGEHLRSHVFKILYHMKSVI